MEEAVALRNKEWGHSDAPHFAAGALEAGKRFTDLVEKILTSLSWLRGFVPIRIREKKDLKKRSEGSVWYLAGAHTRPRPRLVTWTSRLSKHTCYLVNPDGTRVLELDPFLQWRQDGLGGGRLFLWCRFEKRRVVLRFLDRGTSFLLPRCWPTTSCWT